MQVYQTDEDGFFVGTTVADRDPRRPTNWLIPGGCVTKAPPVLAPNQRAKWVLNGWVIVTDPVPQPDPEPSPEEVAAALKETFRRAVQAHIDTTAQARMYDSGASLAGYVNSAVPAWAAEAQAFVAWRDAVWLFVFNRLAQVEAGEVAPPASAQELIDMLPVIAWP